MRKCAKNWESMPKAEKVLESLPKAQKQLFCVHIISRMMFVHMLNIAFGKTLFGLVLTKCASSSLVGTQ